jgi:uncharacterized OsmC-like protein
MEEKMSIENVKKSIEEAIGYLEEHPNEARYTDTAAAATIEETLRCHAVAPDGTAVKSDMPPSVGGGGAAPSPGWLMRAALANCDATLIAMRAAQMGIELTELEVIVDSESDDRGLLGMDDSVPAGPLGMRTRVRIAADGASEEDLREIVEWAEKHSPVADAIRRSVPMSTEVEFK